MLDVDALHALLWIRSGASGVLRLSQSRLADDLCTTRLVIHRVLERMADEKRITKIGSASGPATRTYEITDPSVWKLQKSSPS